MLRSGMLLLLATALTACQFTAPTPATHPSVTPDPGDRAGTKTRFLWRVTRPGGDQVNHLLGTLAIGDISARQLSGSTLDLLQSCRVFVLKMDVSRIVEEELLELARLPEGESLKRQLTDAQWTVLRGASRQAIPDAVLAGFRPWFILPNVHATLVPRASAASQPIDVELMLDARRRGKPVSGLEDWKRQVESVRAVYTIDILRDTLDRLDAVRTRLQSQVKAYQAGDLPGLEKIIFDPVEVERHPRLFEELIWKRNGTWIEPLEKELTEGRAFVALGVEHLLGPRGLLAELRSRGWTIEAQ